MKIFAHVKFAARTDVGRKRKNNEDALGTFPDAGIFCVADGMGGGDDGEIASAAVVKAVEDVSRLCIPPDGGGYAAADVADELEGGLNKASEWIFTRTADKKLNGCGSTFVGVVLDATHPDSALAVHAGDSRLYLLHGRSIKQVTRDHSAAEMIGTKDESKLNPIFRSMVMNAVGIRAKVEPERTPFKVSQGDRILICSDGLSRMVSDKKILSISRGHADVGAAVDALIAAALEAGGIDNVTVVLMEFGQLPEPVKSLPMAESAVECTDDDSDTGTTGGSEAETEDDSALTVQTVQPIVVPSKLDIDVCEIAKERTRHGKSWGLSIIVAVSAGILIGVAAIVAFSAKSRKNAVSTAANQGIEKNVREAGQQPSLAVDMAGVRRQDSRVAAPQSPKTVAAPQPPKTVSAPRPPKTADAPQQPQTATASNDRLRAEQSVTPSAPVAVQGERVVPFCTNLVVACDAQNVDVFVAKMRRLFPDGMPPYDYIEQVKLFEKSAKGCSRLRSVKAVQAAAVDLKIMLQTAEPAKTAFTALAKTPEERRWLADWDTVVSRDPRELSVQEAGARLILSVPEVPAK